MLLVVLFGMPGQARARSRSRRGGASRAAGPSGEGITRWLRPGPQPGRSRRGRSRGSLRPRSRAQRSRTRSPVAHGSRREAPSQTRPLRSAGERGVTDVAGVPPHDPPSTPVRSRVDGDRVAHSPAPPPRPTPGSQSGGHGSGSGRASPPDPGPFAAWVKRQVTRPAVTEEVRAKVVERLEVLGIAQVAYLASLQPHEVEQVWSLPVGDPPSRAVGGRDGLRPGRS